MRLMSPLTHPQIIKKQSNEKTLNANERELW